MNESLSFFGQASLEEAISRGKEKCRKKMRKDKVRYGEAEDVAAP